MCRAHPSEIENTLSLPHFRTPARLLRCALSMSTELLDEDYRPLSRIPPAARVARVLDFLFGLLYTVLFVRLLLEFFGARQGTGFVAFVDRLSDPFYAPFKGMFPVATIEGGHMVWPLLVAIAGYMLLHALIRGLIRLIA
jgi:hypothetical protein